MVSVPIIAHWDLNPRLSEDEELFQRVLDDVASSGFLVLYIYDGSGSFSAPASKAVERLAGETPKINLTIRLPDDPGAEERADRYVTNLYYEVSSLNPLLENIDAVKTGSGPSFPVRQDNAKDIPDVVRTCWENGIRHIHFPIQRISGEERPFYAEVDTLDEMSNTIEAYKGLEITVHDPFLWRALNPGHGTETKGCSGADTMIYISPDLNVTPCPLIPLSMGNLRDTDLGEIFISRRRHEIREVLSSPPVDCFSCAERVSCAGGCRGRAYQITGGFENKDPACPCGTDIN